MSNYKFSNFKKIFTIIKNGKKYTMLSFLILFSNINLTTALRIMKISGINYCLKVNVLSKQFIYFLYRLILDKIYIKYNIIKIISLSKLKNLDIYKVNRLQKNLPVRGQRTKTNAHTRTKFRIL